MSKLLRTGEAADRVGLSAYLLRRAVKSGRLAAVRTPGAGGKFRFDPVELDAFIERSKTGAWQ